MRTEVPGPRPQRRSPTGESHPPDAKALATFLAVAEEGNFTRAADAVGVGQPAVSQAIRRLEEHLGFTLLERSSHAVTLTARGSLFLPYAREAVRAGRLAGEAAHRIREGQRSTLRLGTTASLGACLPALVSAAHARFPDLTMELVRLGTRQRLEAVRSGALDAALVREAPAIVGLERFVLWSQPLVAVVRSGHPAVGTATRMELADLAPYPWVHPAREQHPWVHDRLLQICADEGFVPLPGPRFTDEQDAVAAAATSDAWVLLGAGPTLELLTSVAGVHALPIAPATTSSVQLVHRTISPAKEVLQALRPFLQHHAAQAWQTFEPAPSQEEA